jgi:peptide-methionine (S)-S-oxide reductase
MPTSSQATFAAGCFWCVEAAFLELRGVQKVVSGYAGGSDPQPTYEAVCRGTTGHAEVIQIDFDPEQISYEKLLEVFWSVHDPTTLNRQGADVGTQYRSAIFYHDEEQRDRAEASLRQLTEAGVYDGPIVTEITPLNNYHPAEAYHQNYYAQNPQQPYCQAVARPKVEKVRKLFRESLRN